jgi:hypothetical protein
MALIDDRGRLFGRVNIIDAAVGLLLVGLIPLAYAAFVLFRQPEPTLSSISPAKLPAQPTRVQVRGEKLRPYLRVFFNDKQGTTFALIDEHTAEIEVPELPPGTYDVILYDVAREVSRLRGALTVEGPAAPPASDARILMSGDFIGLHESSARELRKGMEFTAARGSRLVVLDLAAALPDTRLLDFTSAVLETPLAAGWKVPALLRATCHIADKRCQIGSVDVQPGASLLVSSGSVSAMRFEVSDVAIDAPTRVVQIRATFVIPGDTIGSVRSGDRSGRHPPLGDRAATLVSVGPARRTSARIAPPAPRELAGINDWAVQVDDTLLLVEATVRLRADVTSGGLQYRGQPVRVGASFVFDNDRYILRGWIRAVDAIDEENSGRP